MSEVGGLRPEVEYENGADKFCDGLAGVQTGLCACYGDIQYQ